MSYTNWKHAAALAFGLASTPTSAWTEDLGLPLPSVQSIELLPGEKRIPVKNALNMQKMVADEFATGASRDMGVVLVYFGTDQEQFDASRLIGTIFDRDPSHDVRGIVANQGDENHQNLLVVFVNSVPVMTVENPSLDFAVAILDDFEEAHQTMHELYIERRGKGPEADQIPLPD